MSGKASEDCSTVLIVDDDYMIALELALHLREQGFEVMGPFSGIADARAALAEKKPDAAFLDINLGEGRTSYRFANELREQGLPFAFVSGYSSLTQAESDFEGVPLLMKPVDLDKATAEAHRQCASNA